MEILGLLDTLESLIVDSARIPLTKKVIVDEEKILNIIDKIRLVVQGGEDFAKKAIDRKGGKQTEEETKEITKKIGEKLIEKAEKLEGVEGRSIEILQQAYQIAREVREGADKYADEVLSNLEAASSRILRTVRAGRERLKKIRGIQTSISEEPPKER